MLKNIKSQLGQGLLEMIIAIGIINVGLFAVWGLFLSNYAGEQEARARIIGANLAKEGIEIVRNIRDSNWLKTEDNESCPGEIICFWDHGLAGLSDNEIENNFFYVSRGLFDESGNLYLEKTDNQDDSQIYLTADGFFSQDDNTSQTSPYWRRIILRNLCCQDNNNDLRCDDYEIDFCGVNKILKVGVDVESRVDWRVNNKDRNIIIKDQLFNWK